MWMAGARHWFSTGFEKILASPLGYAGFLTRDESITCCLFHSEGTVSGHSNKIEVVSMGVIFGIVNIIIAIWFYATAASVGKRTFMWAVIGALSFLVIKFFGYSMIAFIQESSVDASLDNLMEKGYVPSERSDDAIVKESADEQSSALGIIYEFFPLLVALLGVAYIRAKFILKMGFIDSLKHKTPLMLVTSEEANDEIYDTSKGFSKFLSGLFRSNKKSKSS